MLRTKQARLRHESDFRRKLAARHGAKRGKLGCVVIALSCDSLVSRDVKTAVGILLVAGFLGGCGGDSDESSSERSIDGSADEQEILRVYNRFQRAIIWADGIRFCSMLTRERVAGIEANASNCPAAAGLGLRSIPQDNLDLVRSTQGEADPDDVDIDGDRATVISPSGDEVSFKRQDGEWRLSIPIPGLPLAASKLPRPIDFEPKEFSGNGSLNLGTLKVPGDATLDFTNVGERPFFTIFDADFEIGLKSEGDHGRTFVPAGTYEDVQVVGNKWTVTIRPE